MLDFILCIITNFSRIYLIDRCVSVLLGTVANQKKRYVVCGCFYIVNTALFWQFHTVWINVISNLAGIGAITWLYTRSVKMISFLTCTIYLINCGCDAVVMSLFVHYQDGEVYHQVYAVISFSLIFICELVTEKIITIRRDTDNAWNVSLVFLPICSITVIMLLTYTGTCEDIGLSIVGIGLVIINFLMLHLYNIVLHSLSKQYETERLKAQVQIYSNQLQTILQGEERLKSLRHDMKHHLNELMLLAKNKDMTKMQKYISQMETFLQSPNELVASGNPEIDSVLNYMLHKAQKELKKVEIKVLLPEKVRHSFDINILLGNLLENAIEAAQKTDKQYLGFDVSLKKGILRVEIENSYVPNRIVKETQSGGDIVFRTTKTSMGEHGIGLKNVKKIVEKYNGEMEVVTQDDIFSVNLILYIDETKM